MSKVPPRDDALTQAELEVIWLIKDRMWQQEIFDGFVEEVEEKLIPYYRMRLGIALLETLLLALPIINIQNGSVKEEATGAEIERVNDKVKEITAMGGVPSPIEIGRALENTKKAFAELSNRINDESIGDASIWSKHIKKVNELVENAIKEVQDNPAWR